MTIDLEHSVRQLLVGDAPAMLRLREAILRFGPTRIPILLYGPSGAGKELAAEALHLASGRRGRLAAFNACAVSESMFEDALFGHVRGAFTGATSETGGYLREAQGGTLFLDEITGLPLATQAKLLRALETGVYRPVGGSHDQRSEFRLISATNEDPGGLVREGRFRADLLHRLGGLVLRVPSLAERRSDVEVLARHFVRSAGEHRDFSADALKRLVTQDWPGNVRELRHVIDRVVVLAEGSRLERAAVDLALATPLPREVDVPQLFVERRLRDLLEATSWDVDRVAKALGLHRATLYRRLKRLGIDTRREGQATQLGERLRATDPG